jgi:hypothetical protein
VTCVGELLEQLELRIRRENAILGLKTVTRRDLDDGYASGCVARHGRDGASSALLTCER